MNKYPRNIKMIEFGVVSMLINIQDLFVLINFGVVST
jgi:hypothetical protein